AGAYREPGLVLGYANRLIYEGSREVFATACYMTLDATGQCRFALAGHPPPLVIGPRGAELVHNKAGAPLGVNGASHYTEAAFQLEDSDAVVLYTDGLVERRHEDIDTSLARLVEVARGLTGQIDAHTFTVALGDNARDDVVVLFVQRTASLHEAPVPAVGDVGDVGD